MITSDVVFVSYEHIPEPVRSALTDLADFIGDLDGKTMATPTDDDRAFIDDGIVDADDAVKAFNVIVAALTSTERKP